MGKALKKTAQTQSQSKSTSARLQSPRAARTGTYRNSLSISLCLSLFNQSLYSCRTRLHTSRPSGYPFPSPSPTETHFQIKFFRFLVLSSSFPHTSLLPPSHALILSLSPDARNDDAAIRQTKERGQGSFMPDSASTSAVPWSSRPLRYRGAGNKTHRKSRHAMMR